MLMFYEDGNLVVDGITILADGFRVGNRFVTLPDAAENVRIMDEHIRYAASHDLLGRDYLIVIHPVYFASLILVGKINQHDVELTEAGKIEADVTFGANTWRIRGIEEAQIKALANQYGKKLFKLAPIDSEGNLVSAQITRR